MAAEDVATEAQIKRLYAVLHSIGIDPKQWKKDKNIASYAKLTRAQCSAFIDDAEAIEAQQKAETQEIKETSGRGIPGEKPEVPRGPKGSQPAAAPAATTTDNRAEAEAQRIREEQGLATQAAITVPIKPNEKELRPEIEQPTPILTPEATSPKPTVLELIAKYTDMLAQVTEAVNAEDRIPDREKGYAVKFIFYSVRGAMENGKGGDREE